MVDAFLGRDGGGLLSSIAHLGGGGTESLTISDRSLLRLYDQSPQYLQRIGIDRLTICNVSHTESGRSQATEQTSRSTFLDWRLGLGESQRQSVDSDSQITING